LHSPQRTHAAVLLELLAVDEDDIAGRLLAALAMSPLYCSPPSAMTGTPRARATFDTSWMAVICGTPTPATTRVVQIEPGPTPTLTASAPASAKAAAASAVAMLPPTTSISVSRFSRATISTTARLCPCAVSTTTKSTPASTSVMARL